jgi:hypothetical protein
MSAGGVGSVPSQSVEAVNDIMKMATAQTIKASEKLMKYSVSTAVGAENGKGDNFDAMV